MHDHSPHFVSLFFNWLHHLSCARWGEILGIHRLARGGLLPYAGFARSAGVCNLAASDFDAHSGFSPPMEPARADSALDGADLALRLCHRRARLFDAIQVVPSASALVDAARSVSKCSQRTVLR